LKRSSAAFFPGFCLCLCFFSAAAEAGELLRSPYDVAAGRAFEASAPPAGFSETRAKGAGIVLGGVVPHHDLALGMIVRFYRELANGTSERGVRRVFLFAPDHFRRARRWVAVCPADWRLSVGVASVDRTALEFLTRSKIVEATPELFVMEHGITLHIPLIARFFPGASVVPIVLRPDIPDMALLMLRNRLKRLTGEGDIIILSMDLSHYKPPEAMAREDKRTLGALTALKAFATSNLDVDARRAAALVLALFRDMGATKGEILEYTDSSALLGKRIESGTSYATIIYRAQMRR
jgi:AmmeMemoRadiSam system protein B